MPAHCGVVCWIIRGGAVPVCLCACDCCASQPLLTDTLCAGAVVCCCCCCCCCVRRHHCRSHWHHSVGRHMRQQCRPAKSQQAHHPMQLAPQPISLRNSVHCTQSWSQLEADARQWRSTCQALHVTAAVAAAAAAARPVVRGQSSQWQLVGTTAVRRDLALTAHSTSTGVCALGGDF
jgi:hypothetical protein